MSKRLEHHAILYCNYSKEPLTVTLLWPKEFLVPTGQPLSFTSTNVLHMNVLSFLEQLKYWQPISKLYIHLNVRKKTTAIGHEQMVAEPQIGNHWEAALMTLSKRVKDKKLNGWLTGQTVTIPSQGWLNEWQIVLLHKAAPTVHIWISISSFCFFQRSILYCK